MTYAKVMASHYRKDSTYNKISAQFFGIQYTMMLQTLWKKCMTYQKQGSLKLKTKFEMYSIPALTAVMNQVGVDICNLPQVDGYCCLVVYIDYFRKWSEGKPHKDKMATIASQFLYELIFRHGCFSIQINDQDQELVNSVSAELHRLNGVTASKWPCWKTE